MMGGMYKAMTDYVEKPELKQKVQADYEKAKADRLAKEAAGKNQVAPGTLQ